MNEPLTRAYLCYYRDSVIRIRLPMPHPDPEQSGYERYNSREYVVLRARDGRPLRVYRLRPNKMLRRLLPWPAALNRLPNGSLMHQRIEKDYEPRPGKLDSEKKIRPGLQIELDTSGL